jgi:hypothetical protein
VELRVFRSQPKAKDRRKVPIPPDLRDAMRDVLRLIKEAKRDPDVVLDFDDAIQVGPICGGRYRPKPSRYELRYRPDGRHDGGQWELDLDDFDIEDISSGRLSEITLYCCASPACGRRFSNADGHCDCDYVKDPDFGTFEFPEAREKLQQRGVVGISEGSTRDDVFAALGPADEVGGGGMSQYGYIWPWITYRRGDCQLRFEFGKRERLRNITVMEKDWEPGR